MKIFQDVEKRNAETNYLTQNQVEYAKINCRSCEKKKPTKSVALVKKVCGNDAKMI